MKIVLCGSFGDMEGFLEVLTNLKKEFGEENVFPTKKHLQQSAPCISAHHIFRNETTETIVTRTKLMKRYFKRIDDANLVVIYNEKLGEEYYGVGTTIELGYAFAKRKKIIFTKIPTDSNILSLMNGFEFFEQMTSNLTVNINS